MIKMLDPAWLLAVKDGGEFVEFYCEMFRSTVQLRSKNLSPFDPK